MRWRTSFDSRNLAAALERVATTVTILLSLSFALESVHPLLSVGGMVLTNVELLLLLALAAWGLARAIAARRPQVPRSMRIPALTWLTVLLVSTLLAPSHRIQALKFSGRMVAGVLVAWAVYDLGREGGRWRRFARALAAGGLLVGALGVAEALRIPAVERLLTTFKRGRTVVGETLRVSSTLGYATIASMVLELSVPLLLAWILTAGRRAGRMLLGVGLAVTLASQMLTLTRGGLISLTAALGLMAGWAAWPVCLGERVERQRRRVMIGSLATGAALLALWSASLIWSPVGRYRLVSETEQDWYKARYHAASRVTIPAGEEELVPVRVTNVGVRAWEAKGKHTFSLGYHLARRDGTRIRFEGGRVALPGEVLPGAGVHLQVPVRAPGTAGDYVIEWDMVHEDVTWFSWEGAAPERTRLVVTGSAGSSVDSPDTRLKTDEEAFGTLPSRARVEGRLWLWRVAAGMLAERPLFGVGPDNFRWLHGFYAGVDEADDRIHANNLYVEWLVDTGLLGLLAFIWLSWRLVRAVRPPFEPRAEVAEDAVWQLAMMASVVAWFVHGTVDFFYEFTPTYVAFALVCGLGLAISQRNHLEGHGCASDLT